LIYRVTRHDLLRLDATEGCRDKAIVMLIFEGQDADGRVLRSIAYMAPGSEMDGKPSLRYIIR
jgi:hypothetical protein